jgi:signal transduction histidine kinase/CheY-like chemotaxis protein
MDMLFGAGRGGLTVPTDGPVEGRRKVPGWGYGLGLMAVLAVTGIKLALGPFIDAKSPFLLFLGVVMAAAWFGGLKPGLATTLMAALAGGFVFMPAGFPLFPAHPGDAISLGLFLIEGSLISLLAAQLRTARGQANLRTERALGNLAEGQKAETVTEGLRAEIATLDRLGLTLSGHLDMEKLAKAVTEAGVAITGAAFGAFVYKDGSGSPIHYVSGAPPEAFVDFPLPQDLDAFGSPFLGAISRSDDLTQDSRYGPNLPFKQMPPGRLPARSYLSAPVRSADGAILGGLFFGHPDPEVFQQRDERLVAGLAAHAGIAADNAHLYREAQLARTAAEAAGHVKDEFLATLSHELRTPLTSIVGWAELLQRRKLSPDETRRAIDTIIRNANAQSQIINELLDVSRIITGKLQLDLRPVEIGAAVKAAVETVTPAANAKGIRLQFVQDPAGSYILGDSDRLQQVFWNLLFNAIKFTPKNGRVRVIVQSVDSNVEVVVSDTGLGIDPEFLPRMFERFTQGDSSSTRSARGLGLGLSIARQLVELHGGTIQADSAGVGYGSTFTVSFPFSPVRAAPSSQRGASRAQKAVVAEEAPDLAGIRVLLVEDDDDARLLLEKVLKSHDAHVRAVPTAREALDILERERVDVLLSDIEMPGTDGYTLIKELRMRPPLLGGAVPAVALTAYARTEDRVRALRAGFQLHLAKPVQPFELVTVVASLATRSN